MINYTVRLRGGTRKRITESKSEKMTERDVS